MSTLQDVVARYGGIARASEFRAHGIGAGLLYVASHSGELIRVRKGWYANPSIGPDAIRAARVGGALACASAAKYHGLWELSDDLHVVVPSTAARLRNPDDYRVRLADQPARVVIHWAVSPPRVAQTVVASIDSISRCVGNQEAFVVLESAMNRRLISAPELALLRINATGEFRTWIDRASAESESGGESLLKDILDELGLPYRQQVYIAGVGRVDFVVGGSLILEADSRRHHADPARDIRRDAAASKRGYRSLRYLYEVIAFDREVVRDAILGAVIRGDAA